MAATPKHWLTCFVQINGSHSGWSVLKSSTHMRTKLLFTFLFLTSTSFLFSQTNPWSFVKEADLTEKDNSERQIIPQQYRTLKLDIEPLKALLNEAPHRGLEEANKKVARLTLPLPDGQFGEFRIFYTPVMHEDLAAKYPMIRTYSGYSINDPATSVYFDLTQKGFHGYIRSPKHSDVFIDPYSAGQIEEYIVYYKKDFYKESNWQCMVETALVSEGKEPNPIAEKVAGDNQHRVYSLALACTGEYSTFHGGNKPAVLAAMNTTMNRVNGVTENEFSVRMELVANNDDIIYLNSGTDPYTNSDGCAMLSENQTTCDTEIGAANYDIGHVFSTGGGGVAALGCVCDNSIKAEGVTGQSSPVGDPFDIDFVAHEMGHQFGANHTQNNACNRNNATAMEPGSASTIMGYAGICPPDVQSNSDVYYHAASLEEIGNFITGGGNSCATKTTSNNLPTANAGANYTIPKSTYFVLTGSGTDSNGDTLAYCWEQIDNQVATMPPVATSTTGPMFRSLSPTESPDRYFPNINDIVNNNSPTWEVLPSNGRTFNFRLTVRDNHFGGGATEEDDMVVTVEGSAGPFLVTAPNTNVSWEALSNQTVTWDVAGTTAAPVSSANVDIFLSTDGGLTYPITILSGTPNDGMETVAIPNNQTSNARIMVRGTNNIFFDISNTDFTISPPATGFAIDVTPNLQAVCAPANGVFDINVQAFGGFSGDVDLSVTGVPAGASSAFSVDPVAAPGTSQLTISGTGSVPSGTYDLTVTGSNGGSDLMETVTLVITSGSPAMVTLIAPADGATSEPVTPTLSWNAASEAATYELQVAEDAAFSTIIVNQTGITNTSYNVSGLNTNTTYHWRVRGVNGCGNGNYSTVYDFTTLGMACDTIASTDVPKTIDDVDTDVVTSTLTINETGTLDDINLVDLDITHTWVGDLRIKLKSPAGTEVILVDQICDEEENMLLNFDDESPNNNNSIPCPPTNNGTYKPQQAFTAFDNENINGIWILTVEDLFEGEGGTINGWGLDFCYQPSSFNVNITSTNVTCNGLGDGTATANPTGGTGSYSYMWNGGGTTQTITGLDPNTYTVTVTSGSETKEAMVIITEPDVLDVTVSGTNPTNVNNGSATANPTGGTPPYAYAWTPTGSIQTISNLGQGTYAVTVTDDNDCTNNSSVYLQCPNDMVIDAGTFSGPLFHADNSVSTSGMVIIPNAVTTDFKAGSYIDLNALFQVDLGAVFMALIEGCAVSAKEEGINK